MTYNTENRCLIINPSISLNPLKNLVKKGVVYVKINQKNY